MILLDEPFYVYFSVRLYFVLSKSCGTITCISMCLSVSFTRLPNILEYLREPLQAGLGDRSSYVRKTTVMGIVKLFHVAPEFIEGMYLYIVRVRVRE